jgi:hypothetical protein
MIVDKVFDLQVFWVNLFAFFQRILNQHQILLVAD